MLLSLCVCVFVCVCVCQERAHDLVNRLNQLDKRFSQYFDYIYKASKRERNFEDDSSDAMDMDEEAIIPRIPPAYKRQASSGESPVKGNLDIFVQWVCLLHQQLMLFQ